MDQPFVLAIILKPFALLFLAVFVFLPVKYLMRKHMRDSRLKRLLLREIGLK